MLIKFLATLLMTVTASTVLYAKTPDATTAAYYHRIEANPEKRAQFLYDMPKGGDLHNHAGGSSLAENMLQYAKDDRLCLDPATMTVRLDPACPLKNDLATVTQNPRETDKIIDAWSMRHFHPGNESGHDHFFATFGKFGAITAKHTAEILTEIVDRAGRQNEIYLELMVTPDNNASGMLGKAIGWKTDWVALRKTLLHQGLPDIVSAISTHLTTDETFLKKSLHCGTAQAAPGCNVKIRYLYQILREQPPAQVFAQLLAGFEAASNDPRIVGINMVQPEDGTISMRDYVLHMHMVDFLHQLYPHVHISLHAGELVPGLVQEEGLRFHIRDAVDIAHAERIGHGIDISHETHAHQLLDHMAKQHILVEINLTSNARILNIAGKNHPLPLYLRHAVPLALSTDDEGVDRTTLTAQYEIAASRFRLSYFKLKTLARNSIAYSFLPGLALWTDHHYQHVTKACDNETLGSDIIAPACQQYLNQNEKARTQWELEKRFLQFEHRFT